VKLVDQARLSFREGTSDKVYEVDLCEVAPGQYVVNFRYGRRGAALREGSKTPAPVPLEKARRIYAELVGEKTGKGYKEATAAATAAPAAEPAVLRESAEQPRAARLVAQLGRGERGSDPLGRLIWKVGLLRLRGGEAALLEHLAVARGKPDQVRTYSIVWALARCGGARSVSPLDAVARDQAKPRWVRDLALEALRQLVPERVGADVAALPPALREAHGSGDAARFERALFEMLDRGKPEAFESVTRAYRIDDAVTRPAVRAFARRAALSGATFERLRHIYKVAELRGDGELFGIVGHRFETTPAYPTWQAGGRAFTGRTRRYLRRRTARALRRLGDSRLAEFIPMASGVLLAFSDDDAVPVRRGVATWDEWAPYWALNFLLHRHSERYRPGPMGSAWRLVRGEPGDPPPAEREEAYPALWQARPDALLDLLRRSRCAPVHLMAARAIRSRPDFLSSLTESDLILLLRQPYEPTNRLAIDLAAARPLGGELLRALLDCRLAEARALAHRWLEERRTQVMRDSELLAALVVARFADTREFALQYLRTMEIDDETARLVIGRAVAALMALGAGDEDEERAAGAAATLLRVFARQLSVIGVDVVRQLVRHPARAVQELAGELLLNHAQLARAVPEDLLEALLDSPHGSVRGIGARLFGQLPDAELIRHPILLVHFATSEHAELRSGTRAALGRVAAGDPDFGRRLATELARALLQKLPEGAPAHVVSLLRHELAATRPLCDVDEVLRMVHALSPHAQEVGGLLLGDVDPEALALADIVRLAGHDVLSVREASWSLARRSLGRFRVAMPALAKLVDTGWEDSRRFALGFLEEVGLERLGPEVLVALCDSVRPEVQAVGRELIARTFEAAHGVEYLLRLCEHPAPSLQLFVSAYVEAYAAGQPQRVRQLEPYFRTVLSQVNRGAVAKARVLDFLAREVERSAESAAVIAPLLARQSATIAVGDKARLIAAMVEVAERHPEVELPIAPVEVERRAV